MADGIMERAWKRVIPWPERKPDNSGVRAAFFPTAHTQRKEQESLNKYSNLFSSLCPHILQAPP